MKISKFNQNLALTVKKVYTRHKTSIEIYQFVIAIKSKFSTTVNSWKMLHYFVSSDVNQVAEY